MRLAGGFLQRPAPRCVVCKITLSKYTLPKGEKDSQICKDCLSTSDGGIFFLTKEGDKLGNESKNNEAETTQNLSCSF